MPDLMGITNPVPGHEGSNVNRNIPVSPNQGGPQIQNVPDPTRVVRPDGKTEQQDAGTLNDFQRVRYDSSFQNFLQRLKENPDLLNSLSRLFMSRQGTVVRSGMAEGIASEISQVIGMLEMNEEQLLHFLTEQFQTGSRFNGPLFALLRQTYNNASSDEGIRADILQFLKRYSDFSSTSHLEGNMLRNLNGMADTMPASWGEKLRQMAAQLADGIAAGDRQGNLDLMRTQVFPYMSRYVEQTHDLGTPRALLSLLALDIARYENGSESSLFQAFHQLKGYTGLRDLLGPIGEDNLLQLLKSTAFAKVSAQASAGHAGSFADKLAEAAARALRGAGTAEEQEVFKQVVNALLINESVYMPVNHLLVPLQWDGHILFSELWVDPDDNTEQVDQDGRNGRGRGRGAIKFLFKIDVQSLGLFDIVLTSRDKNVDIKIFCPERVAPFTENVEQAVSEILSRNGLTPGSVQAQKMGRPLALTEVFPKIFEGMNSINVKA